MADNVLSNPGSGAPIRCLAESGGVEWAAGVAAFATTVSAGANVLQVVTPSAGLPVAQQGTWAVTANAGTSLNTSLLALETGGNLATIAGKDFATQTTLAALSAKVPALGQALAAASVPVVLTAIQAAALTPPAAITGFALDATLSTLSGKVTACNTGAVVLAAGSATIGAVSNTSFAATQSGSWTVQPGNTANTTAWLVTGTGGTFPVTGTVTANAGTNLNTSALALETGGNLATLAGAVTSAKVQINNSQINGVAPLMGNGVTGTGSQRVTIASDNTAFSVNAAQSGTWNVTNISGAVSLPTGAATEATLAAVSLSQGSTTSGQKGSLHLGAVTTAAPSYTTAQSSPLSLTTAGGLRVDGSGATQPATLSAGTSGGATPFRFVAAGGANQDATVVKASAGQLHMIAAGNPSAASRYVKFYNLASGATSASTPVLTIFVPAGGGNNPALVAPLAFSTGISFRVTTGLADSDTGTATAGDVVVSLGFA